MTRRILFAVLSSLPRRIRLMFESCHYSRLLSSFDLELEPDLSIALQLIEPRSTVMDVGASVGLWSINLAKRVGDGGRVIAVEPVPTTFAILKKMVARSAGVRAIVDLHNCALSERRGQAAMKLPRDDRGFRNHYCARIDSDGDILVNTETLDNICASVSSPVRFLKIDTEGHELSVVRGAVKTLRRYRPILCIEICTDPDAPGSDGARLMSLLGKLEYACYVRRHGELCPRQCADVAVNYFFIPNDHRILPLAR